MRTVAIIQARMTSTRLPGKVLADLAGAPVLSHVIRRVRAASSIDEVVVATTTNDTDDPVVGLADAEGARWFRGPEADVLARYVGAAGEANADAIVRVTADCPLLDPAVVDRVVGALAEQRSSIDYASNVVLRSFPRGLDTEAFFMDVLQRVDRFAVEPHEREHVTAAIYSSRASLFVRHDVVADRDDSDLRWTIDYPEDLEVLRIACDELDCQRLSMGYSTIVEWFRLHPDITEVNSHLETWSPPT